MTSTPLIPTDDTLIGIAHRSASRWRCLFVRRGDGGLQLEDAIELDSDAALNATLGERSPGHLFAILPGSATVCRTTLLPDVQGEQLEEALRLQAEARLLGGTPRWRRAMAPLDAAPGETSRTGLIVAWPEGTMDEWPSSLQGASVIPDVVAIAALLDGLRPAEPLLWMDPADGSVTLALSHANGAAFRAIREDTSDDEVFVEGVVRTLSETASAHSHTPTFTDDLITSVQEKLRRSLHGEPLLLLPEEIRRSGESRLPGAPDDPTWWEHWGIAAGAAIASSGALSPLTTMCHQREEEKPSIVDRWVNRLAQPTTAFRLTAAVIALLAFGPLAFSGLRLSLLTMLNGDLDQRYAEVVAARQRQVVYSELAKSAWPMAKLAADITNNTPIGIEIDSLRLNVGEPILVDGRALDNDGVPAAELIAQMQASLQATGVFRDIQFSYEGADTYGDRDFSLWARVVDPLKRPRYAREDDFAIWTYAMHRDNIHPDDVIDSPPPPQDPTHTTDSGDDLPERPQSGEGTGTTNGNRSPRGGSSGGSRDGVASRSEDRGGSGAPIRAPEPISADQIAVMSRDEVQVALRDGAKALKRLGSGDAELKARLRGEQRLLLDRLKEIP
ncbi:MAG: hypothetical protein QGH76_09120 [Phycisphaerales bacterium]|nr:hypothetical protein [Phycisphaerales bacterium]